MKIIKRLSLVCLSLALLLTACQKPPKKLTETAEYSQELFGKESSVETDNSGQNIKESLDDLTKNIDAEISEVLNSSYDNMIFPHSLKVNVPEKLGVYRVKYVSNFLDKADDIFREFIPANIYDSANINDGGNTVPKGPIYDDKENKIQCSIGCNGFCSFINGDMIWARNGEVVEKSYLAGCQSEDKFPIGDKEMTVAEMEETAKKEAERFIKASDCPMELLPVRVVVSNDEQGYFYTVNYAKRFKGVDFFPFNIRFPDKVNIPVDSLASLGGDFQSSGSDTNFVIHYIYEEYEMANEYETIISFKNACAILNRKLAAYKKYDVLRVDFVYFPNLVNYEEGMDYYSDAIEELTPYWAFYFNIDNGKEAVGLVNCNTGEAEFINNAIG